MGWLSGRSGNLLIADASGTSGIRLIATTTGTVYGHSVTAGHLYLIAGGGDALREKVPATQTDLTPLGLALDKHGNIVIADFGNRLVRVMATSTGRFYGQPMKAGSSTPWPAAAPAPVTASAPRRPGSGTRSRSRSTARATSSWPARVSACTRSPRAPAAFYGVHMSAGHLYAVAGNGQAWSAGAGGPATRAQIFTNGPVTYDRGNLVLSGWHPTRSSLHAKVRLVPAKSGTFFGHRMKAGHIYVIAGTDRSTQKRFGILATQSSLEIAGGLAVDAHGNLLITGSFYVAVLAARAGTFYGQRMRAGFLYKIAGDGDFQHPHDGGPALKSGMDPGPLAVDSHGNVVLTDVLRIRVVAAHTGTFYGVPMKAGDIYTIAGNGEPGTGGALAGRAALADLRADP